MFTKKLNAFILIASLSTTLPSYTSNKGDQKKWKVRFETNLKKSNDLENFPQTVFYLLNTFQRVPVGQQEGNYSKKGKSNRGVYLDMAEESFAGYQKDKAGSIRLCVRDKDKFFSGTLDSKKKETKEKFKENLKLELNKSKQKIIFNADTVYVQHLRGQQARIRLGKVNTKLKKYKQELGEQYILEVEGELSLVPALEQKEEPPAGQPKDDNNKFVASPKSSPVPQPTISNIDPSSDPDNSQTSTGNVNKQPSPIPQSPISSNKASNTAKNMSSKKNPNKLPPKVKTKPKQQSSTLRPKLKQSEDLNEASSSTIAYVVIGFFMASVGLFWVKYMLDKEKSMQSLPIKKSRKRKEKIVSHDDKVKDKE